MTPAEGANWERRQILRAPGRTELPVAALFDRFNVWLTLELTNMCNLCCTMCEVRNYDPLPPGFMEADLFNGIMQELVERRIRIYGLKLFWLGEPLLHPAFPELLMKIPAKQVNETVVFDTNCLGLDEATCEAIVERCRDCKVYLFLSLDALTDGPYGRMRVGGDRALAYANVHRLLALRKKAGLDFPKVRLQFIVHRENHHEAGAFIDYWRKQDYWKSLPVMDAVQDDRDFVHLRRWIAGSDQAEADRLYDATLAALGIVREAMPANIDQRHCDEAGFPCENLFAMPMVRHTGDITVCNNDLELALRIGSCGRRMPGAPYDPASAETGCGSFVDVWCGEAANKLRRMHLAGRRDRVPKCAGCRAAQRTYFPDALAAMRGPLGLPPAAGGAA